MSIIVHDGRAHADDFLAACVCLYKLDEPVYRQSASSAMLDDQKCWVLDQGRKFEPHLHNFDHHQIEEEICAFTMILDYFFGKDYRIFMPNLRFIEIFDSYGPERASEFVGIKQEDLEKVTSPIHVSLIRSFSKIEGLVQEPFASIMKFIGQEICEQIEGNKQMLSTLTNDSKTIEHQGILILDTTNCVPPNGFKHEQLPTKAWSKMNNVDPVVILTRDSRQNGYRMVSINTKTLKFKPNDKCYFVHNSGFLCGFEKYDDYSEILSFAEKT